VPADTSAAGLAGILATLRREAYYPTPVAAGAAAGPTSLAALNVAQRLGVGLGAAYYEVAPAVPRAKDPAAVASAPAWQVGWHLRGVGRGGQLALRPTAPHAAGTATAGHATFRPHPALAVDYDNTEAGLRQTFRLSERPAGPTGPLRVELTLETALHPVAEGSQALRFENAAGQAVLHYGSLHAWDATGRTLPMHLALGGRSSQALALVVDDAGAQYPLTIDPLATTGTFQTLLDPNTTVTSDAFGYSVAGAGDLNGDGYGDLVVGAYRASTTDNTAAANNGRAYVYYGSATGLGTAAGTSAGTRQTLSDPNTTATTDFFGYSVAGAGDLNGDGYADLVVGAYNASPTDNAAATGNGRAYIYYGSASGLGITVGTGAGTRQTLNDLNTTATNDFFGFSVAGAGDLNGDGYADLVVGAYRASPTNNAAATDNGRAYIYYGSATGLGTAAGTTAGTRQTLRDPNTTATADAFGYSVAGAGDLNGDGYTDLVVGAYRASTTDNAAVTDNGRAYVYYGSATGLTNTVGTTAGTRQTLLDPNTTATADFFGVSVAGAGDLNGDGYADLVVGAYNASLTDNAAAAPSNGRAYIYYGSATGLGITMGTSAGTRQTLNDPNTTATNDFFGYSVAGAGDVNGDGYADLVVGAIQASPTDNAAATNNGRAYVYYGSAAGLTNTAGTTAGTRQTLNDPNTTATYDYFGFSVAGAGDLNGDGYGDLVVGAHLASTTDNAAANGQGRAYVYVGSPAPLLATPSATQNDPNTATTGDFFGFSVAGAGDVNGDGYGDVIVGAHLANTTSNTAATNKGRAYLFLGSATGLGSTVGTTAGTRQILNDPNTTATSDHFGRSVAGAGDVNGDGYADVIVGAQGANTTDNGTASSQGRAYLFLGSATGLTNTAGTTAGTRQTLNNPNTTVAFDYFGFSVAGAGDVNGDGYGDVIVGAYGASTTDNSTATGNGRAYLFLGSATGLGSTVGTTAGTCQTLNDPNTTATYDTFGRNVAGAGDVNGDGYADVIVGALGASSTNNANATNQGRAYLFLGSAAGLTNTAGTTAGTRQTLLDPNTTATADNFGWSVAGAGDVNGDGYADVIVGAYAASSTDNAAANGQGRAYLFLGSATGLTNTVGTTAGTRQTLNDPNTTATADNFGRSVAGAGDVNGDGYADIIIGAYLASTTDNATATGNGRAYLYLGSATGLTNTTGTTAGTRQPLNDPNTTATTDNYGWSVAGAGDVDADGYADVIIGAYRASTTDNAAANTQGRAYLYLGNQGDSRPGGRLRLYNTDLSTPLTIANIGAAQFGIGLTTRSVQGRVRARLVWEVAANGAGFLHASPVTNSVQYTGRGLWTDLPVAGTELKQLVDKAGYASYVRARLEYATASPLLAGTAPPAGTGGVGSAARYGPWQYVVAQSLATLNATPLPVELLAFTAQASGPAAVQLTWTTASEKNSARFEVERSLDGKAFEHIGSVAAQGTNASRTAYTFLDPLTLLPSHPQALLYYRLRQVDRNGSASYSPVRVVSFAHSPIQSFTIFPNPARTAVAAAGLSAGATVEVFDALGRPVAHATAEADGTARLTLPAGLAASVYIVRSGTEAQRLTVE
jgi:hypothetical protein